MLQELDGPLSDWVKARANPPTRKEVKHEAKLRAMETPEIRAKLRNKFGASDSWLDSFIRRTKVVVIDERVARIPPSRANTIIQNYYINNIDSVVHFGNP